MLHTPHFDGDYALGWVVQQDGRLWHNGSNTLWYAEAAFMPGASAFAAANDGYPETEAAVGEALRRALGTPV
jgi:hypothetical protein